MKHKTVVPNVMDRVVRYEKNRSSMFLQIITGVIIGCIALCLFVLGIVISILWQQDSFSMLLLFLEDQEIIRAYWSDVISIFLQEIPYEYVILCIVLSILLLLVIVATRKKRTIAKHTLENIAKYQKKSYK